MNVWYSTMKGGGTYGTKSVKCRSFCHIELNIPVSWTHPMLHISENQKSMSRICLKLLNFEFCDIVVKLNN